MKTPDAPKLNAEAESLFHEKMDKRRPDRVPESRVGRVTPLIHEIEHARDEGHGRKAMQIAATLESLDNLQGNAPNCDFTTDFQTKMIQIHPGSAVIESWHQADKSSTDIPRLAKITQLFWMAKTLVTHSQWKSVMKREIPHPPYNHRPNPNDLVTNVSWNDAMEFCAKATETSEYSGSIRFTLPTEAQWEYCYLAGRTAPYTNIRKILAFESDGALRIPKTAVLDKQNPWGLCDIYGRVFEWCVDSCPNESLNWALCRVGWLLNFTRPGVGPRFYQPRDHWDSDLGFRIAAVLREPS